MYSTLVVPLDGSAFGERALPAAVALARRSDALLELVHVREPAVRASGAPVPDARFNGEAEQQVRSRVSSLADTLARDSGLTVKTVFLEGETAAAIQAYVAARGADLVVMTSHGRGGLSRAWLGSVADELVRRATAPLLLIRPDEDGGAPGSLEPLFQRILVPLDGSPRAEDVLTHALALGTPEETDYFLLNVCVPRTAWDLMPGADVPLDGDTVAQRHADVEARAGAYLERVAESLREVGARVTTHTAVDGRVGHAILDFAREHGIDLIVLSTRVRGAAERLLLGSVADKVLRGAAAPLLLCGPRAEHVPRAALDAFAAAGAGREHE